MSHTPETPPVTAGYRPVSSSLFDEMERDDAEQEARRKAALPDALTVVTWNVEWAPPRKRAAIRERLSSLDADVIVLTEGDRGVLPKGGHVLDGGDDWGYTTPDPDRRKVIMWSKHPLRGTNLGVPDSDDPRFPSGRFASAAIETSTGEVRLFGVCIPWRDAHVRTGRRDATAWSEHMAYLDAFQARIGVARLAGSACILGDFNQRIPRRRAPQPVFERLMQWLDGFEVLTEGEVPGLVEPVVDHIAVTPDLAVMGVRGIDRQQDNAGDGRALSDHHLVMCRLARVG